MKNIFLTKEGKTVIGQTPNAPIVLWAIFLLLGYVPGLPDQLGNLLDLLQFAALFTWAYLEITEGVNTFRKILGMGVIVAMIVVRFV